MNITLEIKSPCGVLMAKLWTTQTSSGQVRSQHFKDYHDRLFPNKLVFTNTILSQILLFVTCAQTEKMFFNINNILDFRNRFSFYASQMVTLPESHEPIPSNQHKV